MAGVALLWDRLRGIFNPEVGRAKKDVAEHFKTEQGPEKWDQFVAHAANSDEFIKQLQRSKSSDDKLVLHATSMGALQKAPTVGEVESEKGSGTKYQIRKLPDGNFACTCGDWRYKGSVHPGYACKHIKAHKQGLNKVASFRGMSTGFFDELQKIRTAQHIDAEEGHATGSASDARPYSHMLTQDEDTDDYNPRMDLSIDDPEVIVGSNS